MSGTNALEAQLNDPLLYRKPLPFTVRIYPYGFPVDVASDARSVIDSARESWHMYDAAYDRPPLRIHVITCEGSRELPPEPSYIAQRHLLSIVADRENFAICDRQSLFGYIYVTQVTTADSVFFRWYFLDALISTLMEMVYFTSMHAGCIALDGKGVLLAAESGMGKSTLSYACARRGWTYISDDGCNVVWGGGRKVVGNFHMFRFRAEAAELFPELRGRTVGRELNRKPTIEMPTAELPVRTALNCRVDSIVFLNRRAAGRATLTRVSQADAVERLQQGVAVFDEELQARRQLVFQEMAEAPAYELGYSNYEEAVPLLEQVARGGEPA